MMVISTWQTESEALTLSGLMFYFLYDLLFTSMLIPGMSGKGLVPSPTTIPPPPPPPKPTQKNNTHITTHNYINLYTYLIICIK